MRQVRPLVRYQGMPSSVIRRFMYVPDARELTIEFVTGRRYVYAGVPEEEVQAFRSAFNRHIRDCYPCREITSAGAD